MKFLFFLLVFFPLFLYGTSEQCSAGSVVSDSTYSNKDQVCQDALNNCLSNIPSPYTDAVLVDCSTSSQYDSFNDKYYYYVNYKVDWTDTPPCSPLSSFTVPNLDQTTCLGKVGDYDQGVYGTLTYQTCDNTCYITEAQPLSCKDMRDHFQPINLQKCDLDLNKYEDNCTAGSVTTDSNGNTVVNPTSYSFTCTPLGSRVSPCNIERNKMDCGPGYKVAGTCHDNGSFVTEDTLYCKEITNSPDDCDSNTEKWDATKNTCVCADGFIADAYGSCWLPEGTGGTSGTDSNTSANNLVREQKNHKILKDMKKSLGDISSDLNQTNVLLKSQADTLSSIRGDLNVSNHLLNKISDALTGSADTNFSSDFPVDKGNAFHSKVMGVLDTVSSGFNSISSDFERMKAKVDQGFTSGSISGGTSPVVSGTVMGQTVKFDMCTLASSLSTVVYWIAYVSFLIIGLRIFFYGFTLRG